ncbi:unnamed protein product [Discosporangium mesarthrocarpum]
MLRGIRRGRLRGTLSAGLLEVVSPVNIVFPGRLVLTWIRRGRARESGPQALAIRNTHNARTSSSKSTLGWKGAGGEDGSAREALTGKERGGDGLPGAGKTVVVGLSGGVDSAVAASLLVKQGYNVVGAFMKNWDQKDEKEDPCTAEADLEDALSVGRHLGIPVKVVNLARDYWLDVFVPSLEEILKVGFFFFFYRSAIHVTATVCDWCITSTSDGC